MKNKKSLLLFVFLIQGTFELAQNLTYKATIDLQNVLTDKIKVQVILPKTKQKTVLYFMPKIVPGTYSIEDYGKFVDEFAAYTKSGKKLKTKKIDANSWLISKAKKLDHVEYWVNDTFDDDINPKKVFEPTGSNIDFGKNYLINTHCFVGYLENLKHLPYTLSIKHEPGMYGSTALIDADQNTASDQFSLPNYNELVDSPLMYAAPDTATVQVGNCQVLLGVYSPNNVVHAKDLALKIEKLLQAQGRYLGGKLPVNKYAFIMYFTDKPGLSGSQGALEHSNSSVYFLQESNDPRVAQMIMDVSAHEFFHILTPLNIHSEEIGNFDFNAPKMSKHLWLYEGSTEYHAHLAQVREKLTSQQQFLNEIEKKITISKTHFDDALPFTEMSTLVLDKHKDEYGNVYQKGALINMCIDILMRKNSQGKRGVLDLVLDLSKTFGKSKSFKDEQLFDDIEKIAGQEVRHFLDKHVENGVALPLESILNEVGVIYSEEEITLDSTFTLGNISQMLNPETGRLKITDVSKMNDFGKNMAYQNGDEIVALNEKDVLAANFRTILNDIYASAKSRDILNIKVQRKSSSGTNEMVNLSAKMLKIPIKKSNSLTFDTKANSEKLALKKAWLKE
jgi:predicted metalloprotease with PDZ domain